MVVDTNILIEHLRAKDKMSTTLHRVTDGGELFLSVVTLYELYIGATSVEKKNDIIHITNNFKILSFTDHVATTAADIYQSLRSQHHVIEFRDIFIAATCIVHDLPILTLNKKHFARISGLKIIK